MDLAHASVKDEEEGPSFALVTRRSSVAAFLGNKEHRLRCRDAADKFAWLQALADPLQLYADDGDALPPPPPPAAPSPAARAPATTVL